MSKIYTFGHSNRAFSEFLQKLQQHDIDTLVDVRTFPRSRFSPQYNQKSLLSELENVGIAYVFKGKNLGGRGENIDYDSTIVELAADAQRGKKICVMCSEADYKECHRHDMLEPSFVEKGLDVVHILYDKKV